METINYIEIAIAGIILLSVILWAIWQVKKKGLKQAIVEFIVYAEGNIKNNEDKFNFVVGRIINLIPLPFSLFISEEMVENLVQSTFDLVKSALDYKPQ